MKRIIDFRKYWYVNVVWSSGTNLVTEVSVKVLTAPAPSVMKIKMVVISPPAPNVSSARNVEVLFLHTFRAMAGRR